MMLVDQAESTTPPHHEQRSVKKADVLLVDDDKLVLRALERSLRAGGYTVYAVDDSQTAIREAMSNAYDVIVSDINMPGLSGIELVDVLRSYGSEIPVILVTGNPTIDTAQYAVELGVLQYITKPVTRDVLTRAVQRGMLEARKRRKARARDTVKDPAERAAFDRALSKLWMAYQPIVSLKAHGPIAYEALVRSHEPGFGNPGPLLEYAERTGRLPELGRTIRDLCADAAAKLPRELSLFVNLHTHDLTDPSLYSPSSPLASYASRVVLEITERGALDEISDVGERIRRLRGLGYRVAIDDLGAGYAGLTSIAVLEPDYVKLDMSLTRDLAASPVKKRLVSSMVDACRDCGMRLVAEGVETSAELFVLRELGCDLLQGYHFARPSPEFVKVAA
jgi:EAL domain-containing protein (putative c-di-GMP-specific phosphodiesterase class I)